MEKKLKIDEAFANEVCKDRYSSKPLTSCGVAVDREVLDFLNGEKLGEQFAILARLANTYKAKNAFIARVRPDDFNLNYELVDFETGDILSSKKTVRGILPLGEWECFVFRIDDITVKIDDPKVDVENLYAKPKQINIKDSKLFFAPPKRHLFSKG